MNRKICWIYIGSIIMALSGCANLIQQQADTAVSRGLTPVFNPRRVVPSQPVIIDVPFVAASEVNRQVYDKELVIGVEINGEARAYPINALTGPSREIINDTLGGRAIAASW